MYIYIYIYISTYTYSIDAWVAEGGGIGFPSFSSCLKMDPQRFPSGPGSYMSHGQNALQGIKIIWDPY